jgi:hypothetical protein
MASSKDESQNSAPENSNKPLSIEELRKLNKALLGKLAGLYEIRAIVTVDS